MANVPVCAATGPCMPIAQQVFHYALLIGAVGLGSTRLFFRNAYDRFTAFAFAQYNLAVDTKKK